jgi:hypothetical protein
MYWDIESSGGTNELTSPGILGSGQDAFGLEQDAIGLEQHG